MNPSRTFILRPVATSLLMVAILLAGRVGSAITAELASMKVYQEIDALTTMNIPPERMLVLPRLAAIVVMMPVAAATAAAPRARFVRGFTWCSPS